MESIFITINGTEQEFNDFRKELDERDWNYDIGDYEYWTSQEEGDNWYIWSNLYLDGEEDEALEIIERTMHKYNMKEYTTEMYHEYLLKEE